MTGRARRQIQGKRRAALSGCIHQTVVMENQMSKREQGFTLIELMIVVAIIAIIAMGSTMGAIIYCMRDVYG